LDCIACNARRTLRGCGIVERQEPSSDIICRPPIAIRRPSRQKVHDPDSAVAIWIGATMRPRLDLVRATHDKGGSFEQEQNAMTLPAFETIPAQPDLEALKARQHGAWSSGDYAVVGTTLQIVGEQLCEALDVRSGQKVLDVAAGNGNATLAAARC